MKVRALILILYYLTSSNKMLSVISLFILGILAFSNVPALQLYIVKMSEKYLPGTEDISSALNIAAFNVGIALGAYTGGIIVSSSLGLVYTPIVGSIFVFIGFLLTVILYIKERS
jgi:predicted MFS family arabinose efflux permease